MNQSADTVKRLSLELGGNAPFIIFDDADLELAVAGLMASKFRNGGQTCVCGIYDRLAERLCAEVCRLVVGNGLDEGVTIGPMINAAGVEKVEQHVDDALSRGAELLAGAAGARNGLFVTPTVLGGAKLDMRLANEETFGPVAPLFRSATRTRRSRLRTPPPMASWPTTSAPTCAAPGASPRGSNSAWSASTPGWCRRRWRRSAGSSSRASGARARDTGSTNTWRESVPYRRLELTRPIIAR
jgi:hypothetical protein